MAKGQKQRKAKTSQGSRKSSQSVNLTELQKALMNRGVMHRFLSKPKANGKRRRAA